jgi:polyphosphate glucokinase
VPEVDTTAEAPFTLAIDIGGTGLKASVLGKDGNMAADRVRVATTYPVSPQQMVESLTKLVKPLPPFDRISCGFPGMVRRGHILTAPHFVTKKGPGTAIDPKLLEAWSGFDMTTALTDALGKPTKVANDADVQGAAVVQGSGLELVVTLGTGMGFAVFMDGQLLPHLELGHQPFRKDQEYDEQIGEAARKKVGDHHWNRRVRLALANFDALFFFDHLFIGGGNASRVDRDELGEMLERITVVDNSAGILGGIKLWDAPHVGV